MKIFIHIGAIALCMLSNLVLSNLFLGESYQYDDQLAFINAGHDLEQLGMYIVIIVGCGMGFFYKDKKRRLFIILISAIPLAFIIGSALRLGHDPMFGSWVLILAVLWNTVLLTSSVLTTLLFLKIYFFLEDKFSK